MGVPRFHINPLSAGTVSLSASESRHARAVRRLSVGDVVALFDGQGHEATGRIAAASSLVEVAVGDVTFKPRPAPGLTLATALPKGPRQEVLIEKCGELGVAAIQPIETARGVATASAHKLNKWRHTVIEAAKQSGQCWLPVLHEPRGIAAVLGDCSQFDTLLVAAEPSAAGGRRVVPLAQMLTELAKAESILAFVGPEGGWADEEIETLLAANARPVSLGPNLLRIETAAIALAACIHAIAEPRQ